MQVLTRHVASLFTHEEGARRATADGRSYWRLLMRDGRVLNEWDGWDWLDVPRRGQQAVRLCCPNGQVATLGNDSDASGRLFQLKIAQLTMSVGEPDPSEQRVRELLVSSRGSQVEWSHAPKPGKSPAARRARPLPARRTLAHVIGMLQGTDGRCQCLAWEYDPALPGGGQLSAPWEDNVYLFQYHRLGPLRADVLGIRAA